MIFFLKAKNGLSLVQNKHTHTQNHGERDGRRRGEGFTKSGTLMRSGGTTISLSIRFKQIFSKASRYTFKKKKKKTRTPKRPKISETVESKTYEQDQEEHRVGERLPIPVS